MTKGGKGPRLDDAGTSEAAWSGWQLAGLPELHLGIDAQGAKPPYDRDGQAGAPGGAAKPPYDRDGQAWGRGPHALEEPGVGAPGGAAKPPYDRAVMVAPHPDDEVLAAGGLMQRLSSGGTQVTVVSVTDGEASHPRSPTLTPMALADRRARELRRALNFLGLRHATVLRLALPDGGVDGATDELVDCLGGLLGPDVLCVAPWDCDGHPDHDATGRAAARACAATGAPFLRSLVWTWHWAAPGDHRVPWSRARRLELSRLELMRKRWATGSFRSQIAPLSGRAGDEAILTPEMLRHFERPREVFLT